MAAAGNLYGRASFAMQAALGIYSSRRADDDIDEDEFEDIIDRDKTEDGNDRPCSEKSGSPPEGKSRGREACSIR